MLKKVLMLEIIVLLILAGFACKFFYDYQSSIERNSKTSERLSSLEEQEHKTGEEVEKLSQEVEEIRGTVNIDLLDLWKRKVQKLEKEMN